MARLGVLGGSFDPIHNGHLVAAYQVAQAYKLAKVIFVPAGNQWQKTAATSAVHRLKMAILATQDEPLFEVSDLDVNRPGATYTADTLADLHGLYPNDELVFIGGADAISGLDSWKDSQKLLELAKFVAVTRPGYSFVQPKVSNGNIELLEIPALDISSTQVRENLEAGSSLEGLVPQKVLQYIQAHHLYQENK